MHGLNGWLKSIVLVTLVGLSTAGFGDLLNSVINTSLCHYSECASRPKCPAGYDVQSTTRDGCRGFKERNNCCPPAMFANCLFTTCDRESLSCPANYRELDRTRNGCSGFNTKAYCCKESNLPNCFDMSCPRMSESKSCPSEYQVSKTTKGRAGGCESAFSERLTCCLMNGNGAHNTNPNSNSNTEVVSETKTVTLEDGTVQTVTRTQTHSKSSSGLFSSGESTMSAFFKILLFFPLLLSALL